MSSASGHNEGPVILTAPGSIAECIVTTDQLPSDTAASLGENALLYLYGSE